MRNPNFRNTLHRRPVAVVFVLLGLLACCAERSRAQATCDVYTVTLSNLVVYYDEDDAGQHYEPYGVVHTGPATGLSGQMAINGYTMFYSAPDTVDVKLWSAWQPKIQLPSINVNQKDLQLHARFAESDSSSGDEIICEYHNYYRGEIHTDVHSVGESGYCKMTVDIRCCNGCTLGPTGGTYYIIPSNARRASSLGSAVLVVVAAFAGWLV